MTTDQPALPPRSTPFRAMAQLGGMLTLFCVASFGCASPARLLLQSTRAALVIDRAALYPESLEVNPRTGKFLVSSIREGAVYEVGSDGQPQRLVDDEHLTSILGIVVDTRSNRLLVTNSDLGAGIKRSARGTRKEAGVGIYDLGSGRALHYVDLTPLAPTGQHLANGITVDAEGNAYITDSLSPIIYKVEPSGAASVFLTDPEFEGEGVNLNGIVYHPGGFLLVVKKSTGAIYRAPIADPRRFVRVSTPTTFPGGDGLVLVGANELVLVANKTPQATSQSAFVLRSNDDWLTADLVGSKPLGDVYPTTCAALDGKVYVLSSHLDEWISASDDARDAIVKRARKAEIQEIGGVTH
jgi:sugar lactone lactonase YvrE